MTRWRTAAALLLVAVIAAVCLAFVLDHPLAARLATRWLPPSAPGSGTPEQQGREATALRSLGQALDGGSTGSLVWSSNRDGNHELYRADLATGGIVRLTNHPHVDYLSRYSPDGRHIAFLRSRRPWVSFRETDGWDLMVMNADGTHQRRVAEIAYHSMWTPNGREITFRRDNKVMAVHLQTGKERLVYDGADKPTAGRIDDPVLGTGNRLAFALKGVSRSRRGVGILSLDSRTFERVSPHPSACEISWIGETGRVVWVEATGRGGTRVMHTPSPGAAAEELIDLPGTHSHEYFPLVTRDAKWLVWGATADGHEHDRADYEIFAWRLGTPPGSAMRLTWSTSNDQWPDLWID